MLNWNNSDIWRVIITDIRIIPQAVCSRYGLEIGAFFAWPVRILLWIFAPVTYPVAWLLDFVLGHKNGVIYRHAELRELVSLHGEDQHGPLTKDEVSVLKAVLDLRYKTVTDIMTQLQDVFMLSIDGVLDRPTMESILSAGHSRVPVFSGSRENIVGVVLVKNLLFNAPNETTRISSLQLRNLPRVSANMALFEMLVI